MLTIVSYEVHTIGCLLVSVLSFFSIVYLFYFWNMGFKCMSLEKLEEFLRNAGPNLDNKRDCEITGYEWVIGLKKRY